MKLDRIDLLADENISPKVVSYLRSLGLDVLDTKEQKWQGTDDEVLLDIASREKRFVLTHDSDFGTLAINQHKPCYGILYLRARNLKPANVIELCKKLFFKNPNIRPRTIWVIEESGIRVRQIAEEY